MRELEKIFKWLDVNKLCLNVTKSKFMIFQMPQKRVPQLSFNIEGLPIEQVYEFKSNKIELLQKKAIRVLYSKSPIAHTAPLYIKMKQPKLSDLYTCNLLKLYHKLYRNRLPPYFDNFLPEFGEHNHMLRNDLIRLPVVRCEYGEMNAKYQMHLRLRNLANPRNQQLPNIEITADTLGTSIHCFFKYLKTQFVRSYSNICNLNDCFVCANSN